MTSASEQADQDSEARFCADLAGELRGAGVSLRDAERRSGWSKTSIARAVKGPSLPKVDLVVDLVTSLGLEPDEVRRWKIRHQTLSNSVSGMVPEVVARDSNADTRLPKKFDWMRKPVVLAFGMVLAAAISASAITAILVSPDSQAVSSENRPAVGARPQAVEVQNKVALGAADLREDTSPAYLSSRTKGSCSRSGCKIEGTEMTSGVLVVATCQTVGAELVNYNLDSPDAAKNPHGVRSALWYRVTLPDGHVGYLSEVYLVPRDRGGLGMSTCPTMSSTGSATATPGSPVS